MDTPILSGALKEHAQALYNLAWGKPWPYQRKERISKAEIVLASKAAPFDDNETKMDLDDAADPVIEDVDHVYGDPFVDSEIIPEEYEYTCFDNMEVVTEALSLPAEIEPRVVVLKEYHTLRKLIEQSSDKGIVVTGTPGIGAYLSVMAIGKVESELSSCLSYKERRASTYGYVSIALSIVFQQRSTIRRATT